MTGKESGSPMNCSSPTLRGEWPSPLAGEYTSPGSPMEVQYQEEISELKRKLQEAEREIQQLQSQIGKKESTTSKPSKSSKAQSRYWTEEEHERFLEALDIYGSKDVKSIANHVGTRNATQVRTHSQKYFLRLKREQERSGNKKESVGKIIPHCSPFLRGSDILSNPTTDPDGIAEQEQCDKFFNAVRATAFENDPEKRAQLIQEQYMKETPLETIKSWLFVHFKTVERIQTSEVQNAAHSVGAKRLRANQPVSVLSIHRAHSSPLNPYSMSASQKPTTSLINSVDRKSFMEMEHSRHYHTPPGSDMPLDRSVLSAQSFPEIPLPQQPTSYSAHQMNLVSPMYRPRPMSEPLFDVYTPDHHSHGLYYHNHDDPDLNSEPELKPYVPGAPPPSSPAPPPPLFHDEFPSL